MQEDAAANIVISNEKVLIIITRIIVYGCMRRQDSMKEMTIFDGDPGTDDAIAIKLLSLSSREPQWCISTFGNMTWDYTCLNMHLLSRAFGMKSRVACGIQEPFDGHTVTYGDFHGPDGLGGTAESLMQKFGIKKNIIDSSSSIADIAQAILSSENVTYIVTGPLSTLAYLLSDYPDTESHIGRVYIMGGGVREFNKDGDREYNFAGDGIAVKKVFSSSLDITLFPLDISHHFAILTPQQIESIDCTSMPFLHEVMNTNCRSNINSGLPGAVLHDALPVLYLLEPEKFKVEDMTFATDNTGRIWLSESGKKVHVAVSCPENLLYERVKGAIEGK